MSVHRLDCAAKTAFFFSVRILIQGLAGNERGALSVQFILRNLELYRILGVLMVLVPISSAALAQQLSADNVPPIVRRAREAFRRVRKVEWKLKSDHNYEAE